MAEFNTKCPHCNAELVADEEWIGMEVECPTCKQTFIVAKETLKPPKLSMPQIKPETPTENTTDGDAETSFTFVCPECETQVELPIALKGKKYECKACCEESIAEPATEKKCPHCGKMIKFHATICKFCKKNVDVSANGSINLQPISPIGKQSINLQPIQNNNGVNLQPINDITFSPINQSASFSNTWKITRQEIEKINKNYNFCLIGLISGIVLSPLLIGIPILIASLVFWSILIYQFWNLVPASDAETTPGKAIGFLFIPFFNLYWQFVAIWGLSKHFDQLAPQEHIKTIGLVFVISTLCCIIPFVNIVSGIVGLIFGISWIIRMKKIAVSSIPIID